MSFKLIKRQCLFAKQTLSLNFYNLASEEIHTHGFIYNKDAARGIEATSSRPE